MARNSIFLVTSQLLLLFFSANAAIDTSVTDTIELSLGADQQSHRILQDRCDNAPLRFANGQSHGETTVGKPQSQGLGECAGLSSEVGPGVWFSVLGTGGRIRASTCHENTQIKASLLVYTGSAFDCFQNTMTCVTASDSFDFQCGSNQGKSTSVDFATNAEQIYYILVQSAIPGEQGTVFLSFRQTFIPINDVCKRAIGPVPPINLAIDSSTNDATITDMPSYCGADQEYPGVWFSMFGTGSDMSIAACGNSDATFAFSVYAGPSCDQLQCVLNESTYSVTKASDAEKCIFEDSNGNMALRDLTTLSFSTVFEQRYFIYVAHDEEQPNGAPLTSDFRFFASSVQDPPSFPPVPYPTRTPTSTPSLVPSREGMTRWPTLNPTPIPRPSDPVPTASPTLIPVTAQSSALSISSLNGTYLGMILVLVAFCFPAL